MLKPDKMHLVVLQQLTLLPVGLESHAGVFEYAYATMLCGILCTCCTSVVAYMGVGCDGILL